MFDKIGTFAKAIVAGGTVFYAQLTSALADQASPGAVTVVEWATIAASTLVAAAAVWAIPNVDDDPGKHAAPEGTRVG